MGSQPRGVAECAMSNDLYAVLAIVAAVIVYVLAKVAYYMKRSREQWRQVDRSKLKQWDDEDDW